MRILHLIGAAAASLALVAGSASAGETAVLRTGFRLHVDRHEAKGDSILLYSAGGVTELPAASVSEFEADAELTPSASPVSAETAPTPVPALPVAVNRAASPVELAGDAARKFALPEGFVRSVMKAESGFQPSALSPKGAIGLMQLMPSTAKTLGVDPADPRQNAEGGAQYLRELLVRYEKDPDQVLLALAAYNAGPGAVDKYHGVPPYRETREYILRVLKNWDRPESQAGPSSTTERKQKQKAETSGSL